VASLEKVKQTTQTISRKPKVETMSVVFGIAYPCVVTLQSKMIKLGSSTREKAGKRELFCAI
jgi:hypothetical protein